MSDEKGIVTKSKLTALASAIKTKAGASGTYALDDLVDVVNDIETGGVTPTGTKQVSITQNGTTTEDVTDYASAEITVNVPTSGITPSGTINITQNGTVDVTQYAAANVNVGSGGGGASYTELSAVSIKNSSDTNIGKMNNVLVPPHGSVKKFEVEYKDISDGTNDANDVVIAKSSISDVSSPSSPFVGYKSSSGVTMSVKTEINGYAHLEGSFNTAITQPLWVGSWSDANYSKTNAFKYVKFWDNSDNLTHHLVPVLDASNVPCFYDLVNKDFYYLRTGRAMISGEAVL